MSELTYISAAQVNTYTNIDALKLDIINTLARWFPNTYDFGEHALENWVQREGTEFYVLYNRTFQFEVSHIGANVYELTMYAVGRFRRNGSSCDFFERVLDGLEQQLGHPDIEFTTMLEANSSKATKKHIDFGPSSCLTHSSIPLPNTETDVCEEEDTTVTVEAEVDAEKEEPKEFTAPNECERCAGWGCSTCNRHTGYTRSEVDEVEAEDDEEDSDQDSIAISDEESEDEDELIMSMPLRDMTDKQIDRYIDLSGHCPRDECNAWSMNYEAGAVPRYSYVKFANVVLEDRHVSNTTITRAEFLGTTFRNCVFEDVHFEECDFKSVIQENVTFKDCQFTECVLDPYMSLDNSCSVENYDYEEEMRREFMEDNVTYSFY